MSFNEWHMVSIKDIFELIPGFAFKSKDFSENGIPVIKIKNVKALRLLDREFSYIDPKYLETKSRFTTKKRDLLISMTGNRIEGSMSSWVGKVCRINSDKKYLINQRVGILRLSNESYSDKFFLYLLGSEEIQKKLISIATSSGGQANISPDQIKSLEFSVPYFEEQKAIAHILSTLDDKIEVNNQINKTLENMAQAIFKQWFVDFEFPNEEGEPYKSSGGEMVESELGMIPKGWEVGKLDDIATIVMGQSPKGTSYNEVGEGEVFYQGRTDFSSRFPIRRLFTTEPKRMANDGDVLMSVRAPVGDLNVANERCCIGRGLSAISSSADLSSYILYVMHDLRERLNVYNGEGTVFGSINQKDLKSIKVISSCDNKTEIAFDDLIQPIDRMIRNNEDETRRLINLRDRLLPKLLSGEIRVPLDEEGDAS